ncbi:MAG: hypothetical protein SFW35_00565 [Chitinophagales bacterium]|nr:hypothetical protein [Chitinophagales bacterium]
MKRIILILAIMGGAAATWAQTPIEGLRYSSLKPGISTARGMGLSGALGAIGGDQAALTINPAGIGIYRRSEASFTLSLAHAQTESQLNGNLTRDDKYNFNLPNAGFVFSRVYEDSRGNRGRGKWVSVNFGFNYNRLANYHGRRFYQDSNTSNSILADYRDELNAASIGQGNINGSTVSFGTASAWDTYLVNPVGDSTSTQYWAITDGAPVDQQVRVLTRGAAHELAFNLGANYDNKFYFGGSIGIPFLFYEEEIVMKESDLFDSIINFNGFTQQNNLNTSGIGINTKFGIIVRPVTWLRLGAAIHSPNFMAIKDDYSTETQSDFDSTFSSSARNNGSFDYSLNSPFRAVGSLAVFFQKYGFLSVDYEFADYGRTKYRFDTEYLSQENSLNQQITTVLVPTHTIRAGLEVALEKFRLRGGYAYTTSPLDKSVVIGDGDYSSMTYSGGLGYRGSWFYTDITYSRTAWNTASQFASQVQATNDIKVDNVAVTFGFTF